MPEPPLWQSVRERGARALARGALVPTPTEREVVEQGGARFVVRVLAHVDRKADARAAQREGSAPRNPFLPYDEDLFVADLSPTHVGLLNKFPVVEDHLLIVTRAFESQEDALGRADFEALWRALGAGDGLGFYNAGAAAGASQPHKHLQVVPTPLGDGTERVPIEPLLAGARFEGGVGRSPELDFEHAFARLERPGPAAALAAYRRLLRAVGCDRGWSPPPTTCCPPGSGCSCCRAPANTRVRSP